MEVDVVLAARPSLLSTQSNLFVYNSFSARHRQIDSSQLFRYQELSGHTDEIYAMEFSDNGTPIGFWR